MPRVLNKYKSGIPRGSVYIGRIKPPKPQNPFANLYEIGKDGNRAEVIEKYRAWLMTQPELIERIKFALKGRDLVCFCAPLECHGDLLLKIANGETYSQADADKPKRQVQPGLFI
jgi:hypothetical protein